MVDIWGEVNPQLNALNEDEKPFQQRSLDFFPISENVCNTVRDNEITPGYRTDNSILTLELTLSEEGRLKRKTKKEKKKKKAVTKIRQYTAKIKKKIEGAGERMRTNTQIFCGLKMRNFISKQLDKIVAFVRSHFDQN